MSRSPRSLTLALTLGALSVAPSVARAQTLENGVSAELRLTRVVPNLFQPTAAEFTPDGRLVILQQNGEVLVWTGSGAPIPAGTMPVNYDGGEQGLLGLAIDPEFATTNRLYLYYSASGSPTNNRNRVAYVVLDPATNELDVAGRVDILTGIYGPANHNGGGLAFGPDGNLYVGTGDRGCNCNCAPGRANNYFGTCLTNLNGKILRVDREGGIPAHEPARQRRERRRVWRDARRVPHGADGGHDGRAADRDLQLGLPQRVALHVRRADWVDVDRRRR
jgi:glucose/arabinose dehydrogenase